MEIFRNAKVVRFRSHHDKYLLADEDGETVIQEKDGSSTNARWTVEFVEHANANTLRFKGCYGKYLTASSMPFKLGLRGKKVLQTLPRRLDSSLEWEPISDGCQVRFRTPYGQFLRANGGVPPWRNSITHDVPHRSVRQDWILWEVDVLETRSGQTKKDSSVNVEKEAVLGSSESSQPEELRSPPSEIVSPSRKKKKKRIKVKENVSRIPVKLFVCGS